MASDVQRSAGQSTEQHLVSTEQAARMLGVTVLTVRRRIRRGELAATEVRGRFGKEWLVDLGQHGAAPSNGTEQHGAATPPGDVQHGAGADRSVPALVELVGALTARTERLENERAELYGRLGYIQAQLAAKDERIKALEAPKEPIAAPPPAEPEPQRRPWWRFW